jgi:chromosome segregation ATPase
MPKKNTKLTTEEIQSMGEIQQGYQQIQSTIGSIHLKKYQMFQQIEDAEKQLVELEVNFAQKREEEVSLLRNLEDKYGQGSLDITTGEFTPSS